MRSVILTQTRLAQLGLGLLAAAMLLGGAVAVSQGPAAVPAYSPGLGDLMNESMQVHHVKLWLAGSARNWSLAAYEAKELRETVGDVQTFSPKWHNIPVGAMVSGLIPDLNRVDQAISAKDTVKFAAAYQQLTAACNTCHAGAGHPEIKVVEPSARAAASFPDQVFTPAGASH